MTMPGESGSARGLHTRTLIIVLASVVLLAAVLLALLGRSRGDDSLDAEIAALLPKVEAATGLGFQTPPEVDTRTREEVRAFVVAQLEDSATAVELRGQELVLKRLGLIPEAQSLKQIYLDVLEEQIAGYYDPKTRVLYVVDGATPEIREITVSHELIHALQDQHIQLDSIQNIRGRDDRQLAAHAVIEGQATLEGMEVMFGSDIVSAIPGGWEGARKMLRDEQARMPKFAAAPIVVQEMLLFPYISGADFVRRFKELQPGAPLLQNMPASTEQVLHTKAFFPERDAPTEIVLPALTGATHEYENTMGEFGTRLFFYQHLRNAERALQAAAGWDGDRYVLFRSAGATGIVWVSVWDTAIDAGEFRDALKTHLEQNLYLPRTTRVPPANRAGTIDGTEYSAGGRAYYIGAAEIEGRPAVIYVDVPEGMSTAVFDVRGIRLNSGGGGDEQ